MSLVGYLEALQSRAISFRALQAELTSRDMPSAQGWEPLIKKYNDPQLTVEDKSNWTIELSHIYLNHIRYAAKAVIIFNIGQELAFKIADKFSSLVKTDSPFITTFPLPLSNTDLIKASHTPVITSMEKEGSDSIRLFSCYKRAFREREQISLDNFNGAIKKTISEAFTGYEQIFGVRSGYIQSFDCIVVRPDKNRLELQIDNCRDVTVDDLSRAVSIYIENLNKWIENHFSNAEALQEPINFYPTIKKLYKDTDGVVSALGHVTGTDSVKNERMRKGKLDLRYELFHKAGLDAIETTDPYSITKRWKKNGTKIMPSLTIPGHFSQAGTSNATIQFVLINDCYSQEDFDMVLSKLFSENAQRAGDPNDK